jgi:hypothetical protein
VSVNVVGPHLSITVDSTPSTDVQGGDTVDWTVTLKHSPRSTEPMRLIKTYVELSFSLHVVDNTSMACTMSGSAAVPCDALHSAHIGNTRLLRMTDTATIRLKTLANMSTPLNHHVSITVHAAYTSQHPGMLAALLPSACVHHFVQYHRRVCPNRVTTVASVSGNKCNRTNARARRRSRGPRAARVRVLHGSGQTMPVRCIAIDASRRCVT